jgi:glutamine synthetase
VLRALGDKTATWVISTVGPEQEYFLLDKELYLQRLDLIACGRTLFGAPPPKGQELEDQYFGAIKDRVSAFMRDLDVELWKMGITSKTKHNEVAPAQYEMAPVFSTTNIAADHNQLVMETMQKVALRHGMVCLLHEKPYAGVNGSGKHNNWSLATDTGLNLLDPGHTPHENAQFLVFLCALLRAVDTHADIMRATCASSGNDHRLGANEAPPAIISVFLGDELTEIMERLGKGQKASARGASFLNIGVDTLPELPKDNTDRNRTSPFAFTGNKFEFRMVGSSQSISGPNVALNTIVADALDEIATRLEKAGRNRNAEIAAFVKETWKKHAKVVFNGNNYAEEWVKEADKRGLPNVRNAVAALEAFVTPKAMKLFEKHKVLSRKELHSRYDIYLEQYAKHINIEAQTAVQMTRRQFLPAAMRFMTELGNSVAATGKHGVVQRALLAQVGELLASAHKKADVVESEVAKAKSVAEVPRQAAAFRDKVFPALQKLRADVDELESIVPRDLWPVPTYSDMLFKL